MGTPFRFERAWSFAVTPEELWTTLEQTDQYRQWWPWLREFHVDGDGFIGASIAYLMIQAPLPYQLRCTIHLDEAVTSRKLVTRVTGDLEGPARAQCHTERNRGTVGVDAQREVVVAPAARNRRTPRVVVGARPYRRTRTRPVRGARAPEPEFSRA